MVSDDLLRTLGYRHFEFANVVINCDPIVTSHFEHTSKNSTGLLFLLPNEILQEIFLDMDLHSLLMCRSLCQHARSLISGVHQFRRFLKTSPSEITALLRTGTARYFSLRHLYGELCTSRCHACGNFGGFLFLPRGLRCCMLCIRTNIDLMPLTKSEAKRAFGLTEKALLRANTPILHTLIGEYGINGYGGIRRGFENSLFLVSRISVKEFMQRELNATQQKKQDRYKFKTNRRLEKLSGLPTWPDCGSDSLTVDHSFRFQCVTQFPYFKPTIPQSGKDGGLCCLPCKVHFNTNSTTILTFSAYKKWMGLYVIAYSEEDLVEHVKQCPASKEYVQDILKHAAEVVSAHWK